MKFLTAVVLAMVLGSAAGARATEVDEVQRLIEHARLPGPAVLAVGQPLTPERALVIWRALLATPPPPRAFAPRTVLARLVRDALASARPIPYADMATRVALFRHLVVVRPDGYATSALTGSPLARMGRPSLHEGELRVQGLRPGVFYFDSDGVFFSTDASLHPSGPPLAELPLGRDPATAALLGAEDALEQMARSLAFLLSHPVRSLEGLRQLPSSLAALISSSPDYFARYGAMNQEDQIREAARLVTHLLTIQGGAASLGPRLAQATRLPVLGVSAEGALVVHDVALPAGVLTATVGAGAATASLVYMAQAGPPPSATGSWPPPPAGPGTWVEKPESMSAAAQRYQEQVTGAPAGWVYRVRTGPGPKDFVDFDGFRDGVLLEVKGPGYLDLLRKMYGKEWFKGIEDMLAQAKRQRTAAPSTPIQWHFAESEVAESLKDIFRSRNERSIEVVHTPPHSN